MLYYVGVMSCVDFFCEIGLMWVMILDFVVEFIVDGIVIEMGVCEVVGFGKFLIFIDIDCFGY